MVEPINLLFSSIASDDTAKLFFSSTARNTSPSFLFFKLIFSIHAREWATCATCTWIVDQLANGYGSNAEITALVDQYDWKFVPISNPDGYVYTWTTDRLWRKNRVTNAGSPCIGVDANRNMV